MTLCNSISFISSAQALQNTNNHANNHANDHANDHANNTHAKMQSQSLLLKRFPHNQFDKSLRAWDAADEYIIDHLLSQNEQSELKLSDLKHICIINDSFGALSCALARLAPQATINIYTDSYMSQCGIKQNLKANLDEQPLAQTSTLQNDQTLLPKPLSNINIHSVMCLSSGSLNRVQPDLVLLKIPRTLAYLEYLLIEINKSIGANSMLVAGGMVKLVTSSVMRLFEKYTDQVNSSLARKKSRLIFAKHAPNKQHDSMQSLLIQDAAVDFTLHNFANVFCREQVDIGARYLLAHLPILNKPEHRVIDLGCGNGILGTTLLRKYPQARCYFVDESYMAIASAQATYEHSGAEGGAEFLLSHSLLNFTQEQVDTVICNPPFHQQNTVIDDIAWQMFVDAKKALKIGGELRIVGNRHLDHRAKLSKLFGGCKVIASDKKFVVLSAVKQAS